ncbi:hypothetical protein [uncultured Kordia sp.]|uniref:hypothetical protein n=1 Tax=uncultured Kordia sp. TaxID=507699 RepID=UPI002614A509|nr:hypothetical protein [uncultured Kordia sp.]
MKKKNLIKKLQFKKTQVSNLGKNQVIGGGSRYVCEPVDLSLLETCYPGCGLTEKCTQFRTCNNVTFLNCTVYNCPTNDCGTNAGCGTGGNSGGISCPGYEC